MLTHRRLVIGAGTLVALLAVSGTSISGFQVHASARLGSGMGAGPIMGPMQKISQPAFLGYYDGHKDTYLNTDVSSKADAKSMHINYSAFLGKGLGIPAMYLVEGRAVAKQLAVFGSQPGEADYSPLWAEIIVTWKSSAKPALLVRDDQIKGLAKSGKLTMKKMSTVLNCPIIKVGK